MDLPRLDSEHVGRFGNEEYGFLSRLVVRVGYEGGICMCIRDGQLIGTCAALMSTSEGTSTAHDNSVEVYIGSS